VNTTTTRERPAAPAPAPAAVASAAAHPLRAELLRGFAPWAGVAVLIMTVPAMAAKSVQWQGSWGETQSQLHLVSALLGGPLAAAAGCWQGGRERRRHSAELRATAARGPLAQFLVASLPVAVWAAAGHALAAVAALLACLPYASAGRPVFSLLPMDAAFLAAMALVGHVVGRLVAWRLTAPVLALCLYIALAVPSYQTSGARYLSPAAADGMDMSLPVWWQPLAMTAWTGGLAAAAVLAYAARRRYTALLPLAAASAAAVLVAQTGEGLWRDNPLSKEQVCDTSVTPDICVNALHKGLLPKVSQALSGVTDRLEGVENLPVRFADLVAEPKRDEVQLPILTPLGRSVVRGELTDPEQYAWEAAAALTGGRGSLCEARANDPRASRIDKAVTEWLGPSPVRNDLSEQWVRDRGDEEELARIKADENALARLRSMGDEERHEWLSGYFATTGSCDPTTVPAL
jgi:hypothetical protein